MHKGLRWRLLFIIAIMVIGLYWFISPREKGSGLLSRINLGLDLKGGIHLVLQVVTEDALNQELSQDAERIASEFRSRNVTFVSAKRSQAGYSVEVQGVDSSKDAQAREFFDQAFYRKYSIRSTITEGRTNYVLNMLGSYIRETQESTVRQAQETMRRRVDGLGVTEPTIQIYGRSSAEVQDQIIVELPGIDDPDRVKGILENTAQLELRLVKKENGGPFSGIEAAVQANGGKIPEGYEIIPLREDRGEQSQIEYLVVSTTATITGKHLKNARRSSDQNGLPAVSFFLNAEGADLFARATGQHIGDRLAIVLDRVAGSAPVIQDRIQSEGIITGRFTVQQAEDLALLLRSGALPASLRILGEQSVGASLGNDSIKAGIVASIIGFVLVVTGMILYYKNSGFNAVACLIANLILLLGFLGGVGATLTLPGIAGIILTIGMAVDANILIFERIREELRTGKTIRASIDAGFARAFWTIFDTNTTTLIAAAFLFQFGTGPIRGFAVTLTVGLIANVFTAVYVSHRVFEWVLGARKIEELSI